jgi:hypothetical protein
MRMLYTATDLMPQSHTDNVKLQQTASIGGCMKFLHTMIRVNDLE